MPYPVVGFLVFVRSRFFHRRAGSGEFFGQPIRGIFVGFLYVRRLFAISGDWIFALCSESVFPSTRLTISGCEFFWVTRPSEPPNAPA